MTIKIWLENAIHDAERRGVAGLRPLLETLARSTSALRSAEWNFDATGDSDSASAPAKVAGGARNAEADGR